MNRNTNSCGAVLGGALERTRGIDPRAHGPLSLTSLRGRKLVPDLSERIAALTRYFGRPPRVIVKARLHSITSKRCLMKSNSWPTSQRLINTETFILHLFTKHNFNIKSKNTFISRTNKEEGKQSHAEKCRDYSGTLKILFRIYQEKSTLHSPFSTGFGEPMRERSLSIAEFQSKSDSVDESALSEKIQRIDTNVHRREFPFPWLEALFLPEFPSRSAIGEQDFVISNEIGNGSFGRVYRAIAKSNPRGIYAMKIQQKSLILGKKAVQQVRREVAVQRMLPAYVFIARFYASWQTRSKLYTIFQYPVGGIGDMFTLWQEHGVFSEQTVQIYGAELACALDFLHCHDVIYRDLKLENITLDSIGHVKLVDFGLAKELKNGERTNTICGTLQYMSPDIASEKPYSHYVDWWSLAVLLHILVTGKYPYPNAHATHHRHLRFVDYSTPVECSPELGDLFGKMLAVPANQRIRSFNDLRRHCFFFSFNFEDVISLKYNPLNEISNNDEASCQLDVDWNGEESLEEFDENYEFDKFDYFNDAI